MTFPDEITPPLVPERPRRRQPRESDRWSRWADAEEWQDEDLLGLGLSARSRGPLGGSHAVPGAA